MNIGMHCRRVAPPIFRGGRYHWFRRFRKIVGVAKRQEAIVRLAGTRRVLRLVPLLARPAV